MGVPPEDWQLTPDGHLVPGPVPDGAVRVWPYTRSRRVPPLRGREERWVDPLNLLVLGAGVEDVSGVLVDRGWTVPKDGQVHRLRVDGRMRRMAHQLALGPRAERTHVRMWPLGGVLALAAHHEVASGRIHHVVSWDAARATVAAALEEAGYRRVQPTRVVTRPNLRGRPGDGRLWRLIAPEPEPAGSG